MKRLRRQANNEELDLPTLIAKLNQFEKDFEELDKELHAAIPEDQQAELHDAADFAVLRDMVSDLQLVGTRILDKLNSEQ